MINKFEDYLQGEISRRFNGHTLESLVERFNFYEVYYQSTEASLNTLADHVKRNPVEFLMFAMRERLQTLGLWREP